MALYWLVSPQKKILALKEEVIAARAALVQYDGDFAGLRPLIARSLGTAARHLAVVLMPAVAASLPLVFLLAWMSHRYDRVFPPSGTLVHIEALPKGTAICWAPGAGAALKDAANIAWPDRANPVWVLDSAGTRLFELPLPEPAAVLRKWRWWNFFFGNPSGYLPGASGVETVEIDLLRQEILPFGPDWARTWEVPFIGMMVAWSLAIKFAFRIH